MYTAAALLVMLAVGGAGGQYTCETVYEGMRCHEMTSPTEYDCMDSGCGNTCLGGQCVAYITCHCTNAAGHHPPGTSCWRPGQAVRAPDGTCNSGLPAGTAIATFDSNGNYYAGHAAAFIRCENSYTIRAYDQWCCREIGYTTYDSGHEYYGTFHEITNPSCADRTSWPCRNEPAGPTCCNTWEPACLAAENYWQLPQE